MIRDFTDEYQRYRVIGERALGQLSDAALNRVTAPEGNSAAMIVRHMSGNFKSRFTDFLDSDGEKPWRDREAEFAERSYSRAEVDAMWAEGWDVVKRAIDGLTDEDLSRTVTIREQPLSVHAALSRSLAHAAYHVGQLVLLGREGATEQWKWITIPRGGSAQYNAAPIYEKGPK